MEHHPSARVSDRAQAQKARILRAAEKAFIEHGFHAAGMALIAAEAGMSPGVIYRCYQGKHDIILAIIERQLEENRAEFCELYKGGVDIAEALFETYVHWRTVDPQVMSAALFAETSAEATRSATLSQAVAQSDAAVRAEVTRWLETPREQGGAGMPAKAARTNAMLLQLFINGLAMSAIREPALDRDAVRTAIVQFAKGLFPSQV